MNMKRYFSEAVLIFALVLVLSVVVTFVYNLIAHGQGAIDWESAFRLAVVFAVVVPWVEHRKKTQVP